jgi:hypothetical protein
MSKSTTTIQPITANLNLLLRDDPTKFWAAIEKHYRLSKINNESLQDFFHYFNLVVGKQYGNAFLNQILKSFFNDIGDQFSLLTDSKETAYAISNATFDVSLSLSEEIASIPFKLLACIKSFFNSRSQFIENQKISSIADNPLSFQLFVNSLFIKIIDNDEIRNSIINLPPEVKKNKTINKFFGQEEITSSGIYGILYAKKIFDVIKKSEIKDMFKLLNDDKLSEGLLKILCAHIMPSKYETKKENLNEISLLVSKKILSIISQNNEESIKSLAKILNDLIPDKLYEINLLLDEDLMIDDLLEIIGEDLGKIYEALKNEKPLESFSISLSAYIAEDDCLETYENQCYEKISLGVLTLCEVY